MPRQHDVGPRLRGRLSFLLKHAFLTLEDLHEELLAPLGINGREMGVLIMLGDIETGSQQQAAERLGVDRTTMVGLLDALEDKALVVRRPDRTDRRRNVVELTDQGRDLLREAIRASDQAERQLLAGLSKADAAHLRELLARIATRNVE